MVVMLRRQFVAAEDQQTTALAHEVLQLGKNAVAQGGDVAQHHHLVGFQCRCIESVLDDHGGQKHGGVFVAGRIERAAKKKSLALDERSLRIAVDHEDFNFCLSIEGEIGCWDCRPGPLF